MRCCAAALALSSALFLISCNHSSPQPVTITFFDSEGLHDLELRRVGIDADLRDFTRETGIQVNHLPGPEKNWEKLALARKLLQKGAAGADVYGVDATWSGALSDSLLDLRSSFASQPAAEDPRLLASYMVQGRLVAMPYHPNFGVLYYREDLLLRYGYRRPPRTWEELETMARRIQTGERARGAKNFWGFVWPGGASEALTCNALEWQASEGGGRILEADRTVSVDNPHAIHSWERAAHWVGSISPPSVLLYQEWDTYNAFWVSGDAAFARGWSDYLLNYPPNAPFRSKAGVTSVPGGRYARVSALGGFGLGVSKNSAHRQEALRLIEFLTRRGARIAASNVHASEFHELPRTLAKLDPSLAQPGEIPGAELVVRPSQLAGARYEDVSEAYAKAVHSVLADQSPAPEAAAALERELVRITGFPVMRK